MEEKPGQFWQHKYQEARVVSNYSGVAAIYFVKRQRFTM